MNHPKNFILVLITTILFCLSAYAQIQIGQDIDGEAASDYSSIAVSMPDANTVAIGAPDNDGNGNNAGHVRVYEWSGTSWVQKGIDIDGEAAFDYSAIAVSMPDANTVAIGSDANAGNGINAGHVRVYEWSGSSWVQKGIDIDGEVAGDKSGHAVSMPDANTVAIGAHYNDGNGVEAGHVRVFEWNGGNWVQKGIDIDGEAAGDFSGQHISMPDANTVAIGASGNDGNASGSGHVRVYEWNGSNWVQKGIDIDGEAPNDGSGCSVSMPDANTVAIGARLNDGNGTDAGHVRVYEWNGSSWVQKGIDIDGEAVGDYSGYSVSMSDSNTVAIGAYLNDGNGINAGHVRVYEWSGSSWVQKGIDIDGEAAIDQSGFSLSMPNANTVAVGGPWNDGNGNNSGHTRIYSICGTTSSMIVSDCISYTSPSGNYVWYVSGTYMDTISNTAGCDSVISVFLTINNNTGTDVQTACDSLTWIDGNTYYASTNTPTWTLINQAGCDSIVTLNLTISSNSGTDVQTACDSLTWIDGNTYYSSTNTPTWTLINQVGCDSIVTLNLTISSNSGTDVQTACESYTWIDGITYTSSTNTPSWTLTNEAGCDSVVTLDLTVNSVNTGSTQIDDTTLQANATGAQYQWLDCDNNYAVLVGETNQTFFATSNGNYAVEVSENGCLDTSACMHISTIGIIESDISDLKVSPNPTEGEIAISLGSSYVNVSLKIYDAEGRIVQNEPHKNISKTNLLLDQPPGPYTLEIIADTKRAVVRIVKQ